MEMMVMAVGDFKTRFSEALEIVERGGSVCVTYGRSRKPVAVFAPPSLAGGKRKLGLFAEKLKVRVGKDWEMSEQDFLNG